MKSTNRLHEYHGQCLSLVLCRQFQIHLQSLLTLEAFSKSMKDYSAGGISKTALQQVPESVRSTLCDDYHFNIFCQYQERFAENFPLMYQEK